ncbi:MAG: hypothetical protein QXL54_03870 [Candidatus Bathyarchaeia archaeon]
MGGIHSETLQRFFTTFKDCGQLFLNAKTDALTSKEIQRKSGLNRSTVFRVLRFGLEKGFIGKVGTKKAAKYYVKWPETVKSPKPSKTLWETFALQAWINQNMDKIRKFGELPDWFMAVREALLAFDAKERAKLRTNAFTVRVDAVRQLNREIGFADSLAVRHALHPTPIDDSTLAWKEREDKRILSQIRKRGTNVFP